MNVLFANTTRSWGGGEVWLIDMLTGLPRRGHGVFLLCDARSALAERALSGGITTFPVRTGGDLDPVVIWKTCAIIRRNRIDILCANTEKALRLSGIAARCSGVRAVIACREVDTPVKNTLAYRFAYNRLASAVTVNSRSTLTTLLASAPWLDMDRVRVIYKGIDHTAGPGTTRTGIREEFLIAKESPIVCFLGRLDEQKGIRYLMEAWVVIHDRFPGAKLVIVGEGNLRNYIDDFIAEHDLRESVVLAGFRRETRPLLRECSMLVLPSLWEGFGYAALEAMGASLPVVATRTSSLPEVVEDGRSGILVEPANAEALALAVIRLLNDPALSRRLGDQGLQIARERFSMEAMLDAFEKLFQQEVRRFRHP